MKRLLLLFLISSIAYAIVEGSNEYDDVSLEINLKPLKNIVNKAKDPVSKAVNPIVKPAQQAVTKATKTVQQAVTILSSKKIFFKFFKILLNIFPNLENNSCICGIILTKLIF